MRVPPRTNQYSIESSGAVILTSRPSPRPLRGAPSARFTGVRGALRQCPGRPSRSRRRQPATNWGSIRDTGSRRRQRTWPSCSSGVPRRRAGAGAACRPGRPERGQCIVTCGRGRPLMERCGTAGRSPASSPASGQAARDRHGEVRWRDLRTRGTCRSRGGPAAAPGCEPRVGRSGSRPGRVLGGNAVLHRQQW